MKNFFLTASLAFAAILSVCSCSSSYDEEVMDSWRVWVARKATYNNIEDFYLPYHSDKEVDVNIFFPDGIRLEKWNTKEIVTDSRVVDPIMKSLMDKLYDELRSAYVTALNDDSKSVAVKNVITDFLNNPNANINYYLLKKDGHFVLYGPPYNEKGRTPTKYNADWLLDSDENITVLTQACVRRMGTFSNVYQSIRKSTTVYSYSLIDRGKQYKMYEVIYHISYGKNDSYALCNILIQNDGNMEIELKKRSASLMDLI